MKAQAIVYTSNTGATARYAAILGEQTGLPVYPLNEATHTLAKGTPILYLGWLMASRVSGYAKAAKRYAVQATVGVGLCDSGTAIAETRRANRIPDTVPVFTAQGGLVREKLQTPYRVAINMLTRGMAAKKDRTADEERMLALLQQGGDLVNTDNLSPVLAWWEV